MIERLKIGFLEPHVKRYGGIRRILEISNRLVERDHPVTIFVPDWEQRRCDWMRCSAEIAPIRDGYQAELDVLLFNHEPQWHLVPRFERARARVFYALHFSKLYGKAGSWESLRLPVDLRLANSTWTADMVEQEIGVRPHVVLGGINPDHFHPVDVPKRYPVLTMGSQREWKGTDVVREAAEILGLPLETYEGKDLPQSEMAAEYGSAEVFAVGSDFEGFGQPGLEALACGTPLVTTDNGGCRDYAIDRETALVVPPRDPQAMAEAIREVRADPHLRRRLVQNGLELVAERFDWERTTDRFEELVRRPLAGEPDPDPGLAPNQRGQVADPELSVIVLAWDQLAMTQRCVESIRQHTDVPYELILVDNGSQHEAANYVSEAADVPVLNETNHGFARGMNDGLRCASGKVVAFCNNDIQLPEGWSSRLIKTLHRGNVGIVVPALTAAGNDRTVRSAPVDEVEVLQPFEAPPSGVVYLMERKVIEGLGGWGEEYEIASGEDVDLAFKVWTNDLDIVFDARVLVEHVGHGTSDTKLEDRSELWDRNRRVFLRKWSDIIVDIPRLESCPQGRHGRNRATAASVAGWMEKYFRARDRAATTASSSRTRWTASMPGWARTALRATWRAVRDLVPEGLRLRIFRRFRGAYYDLFPDRHPAVLRGDRREPPR